MTFYDPNAPIEGGFGSIPHAINKPGETFSVGRADFSYTGSWHTWTVPVGVYEIAFTVNGAGSGAVAGGQVTGRLRVTAGQVLYICCGGVGDKNGREPTGLVGNNINDDTNIAEGGNSAFGGGGPGGRGYASQGGDGGGGASYIRLGSTTGAMLMCAGGAGGTSGDGGEGGPGGANTGGSGGKGRPPYAKQIGVATGGTQTSGGNHGYSTAGSSYNGTDATNTIAGIGGRGGTVDYSQYGLIGTGKGSPTAKGGGGGGGGYRAGGGGTAGEKDVCAAGGGGGGSNFVGNLTDPTNDRAGANPGAGTIRLLYPDPVNPFTNLPPTPPSDVQVNGVAVSDNMGTNALDRVTVSAEVNDPRQFEPVLLQAFWTSDDHFLSGIIETRGEPVESGLRASVDLVGLEVNTHYTVHLYALDRFNAQSASYTEEGVAYAAYNSFDFWTARTPGEPNLVSPQDNQMFARTDPILFDWQPTDPDEDTPAHMSAFQLQWRTTGTSTVRPGNWTLGVAEVTTVTTWTVQPGAFKQNLFYDWTVRTRDPQGLWGPWANPDQFYVTGLTTPPLITSPVNGEAVDVSLPVTLRWTFRDPDEGDSQTRADFRYRFYGTEDWNTVAGDPGTAQEWVIEADFFQPETHYQFEVRTYDQSITVPSDWSEPQHFHSILTPGGEARRPLLRITSGQENIGCGHHRVYVYDRGGKYLRGEITPLATLTWSRKRDDISNCTFTTNGFGEDCAQLLRELRSWVHEIVVFRDGVRVWEGPITLVTYTEDDVSIEAKDVMAYVYRRIMRQGYNDSYHLLDKDLPTERQLGQRTVVDRAGIITMNAMAPDDPNVLPFLTQIKFFDDARQNRIVQDYSKTAWEEIDDLAATAGLDYTVVGRRIIYWDTHRPIGRLPEMRDSNFLTPPIVTQYGMTYANYFAVTNNNGVYGAAEREIGPEGLIEQLASAYGEKEGDEASTEVLTASARADMEANLAEQAQRGIAHRFPVPLIVRVPDNSTIDPTTNLHINHLIPGVWIPLRARGKVWNVAQWQKLDLVTVSEEGGTEQIAITMSPAPTDADDDPDTEIAAAAETDG